MPWIRKGDSFFLEGEPNYNETMIRRFLETIKREAPGELGEIWAEIERFLSTHLATKHLICHVARLWEYKKEVRWAVDARTIVRSMFNNQIPCPDAYDEKAYEEWWEKVVRRQPPKVISQFSQFSQFSDEQEKLRSRNRTTVRLGVKRKH